MIDLLITLSLMLSSKFVFIEINDFSVDDSQALQWIEFETKMRLVVKEALENTKNTVENNMIRLEKCDKTLQNHTKQLHELSYICYGTEERTDRFQDIESQIYRIVRDKSK
jgi:hypothetical protein